MPTFVAGQDVVTNAPENVVSVDVSAQQPLAKGVHTFQLIVVDDDGLQSDPMTITVVVRDDRRPTAVLRGPEVVNFGQSFRLDATLSSDPAPGQVVRYIWTMLR